MKEEEAITIVLERTRAMRIIGSVVTGNISGIIFNSVLLFIGVIMLVELQFALIALLFFLFFIIPTIYLIHTRLVSRGSKLMERYTVLRYKDDYLMYYSAYPHTFFLDPIKIFYNDIINVIVKGYIPFGFYVELERETINKALNEVKKTKEKRKIEKSRIGLWLTSEDAIEFGTSISKKLDKPLQMNYVEKGLNSIEE